MDQMRSWRFLFSLLVPIAVLGCVAAYKEPDPSTSVATVTFKKGVELQSSQGGSQAYGVSEHDDCTESRHAAVLGSVFGDEKTIRVVASHSIVIFGFGTVFYGIEGAALPNTVSTLAIKTAFCRSKFRFVPQEGHAYDIKQSADAYGQCSMSVTDTGTGASVKPLIIVATAACENPDVWK
jgi:hypothetical protein